jgi:tRNA (cmo5U34)-methyltransferase
MNKSNNTLAQDKLYATKKTSLSKFSFNEQVVDVFPDMITRSVPGYQNMVVGIGKIANLLCAESPIIYDLGCSLGSVSLSIAKSTIPKKPQIIGIDNSQAMIVRCQQHIDTFSFGNCISLVEADLVSFSLEPCDMAVLHFTLQFVALEKRQAVLNEIYNKLSTNGVLVLSEKVSISDDDLDQKLIGLHHEFKRENGYSDLEISQKRSALEDVMKLDTIETHKGRLMKAGFSKISVWYQHYNFLSIIAIK